MSLFFKKAPLGQPIMTWFALTLAVTRNIGYNPIFRVIPEVAGITPYLISKLFVNYPDYPEITEIPGITRE